MMSILNNKLRLCAVRTLSSNSLYLIFTIGLLLFSVSFPYITFAWVGAAINNQSSELSELKIRKSDYPAGFHEYRYTKSHVYKFIRYDYFIVPPGWSAAGERNRYKRVDLVFSASFPCDHCTKMTIENMTRQGSPCEARLQIEENYGNKEYPSRPPVPIGDTAAVKYFDGRACKKEKFSTSTFIQFGFAVGDILVYGHIGGSAARQGCDIVKPPPTANELYRILQTLANNLRKYVGTIPPLSGSKVVSRPGTGQAPPATGGRPGADTPSGRRTVKVPVAIVTPDGSAAGVQQVEIPVGGKGQPPPGKIETPTTPPGTKTDTSPGWQPSEQPPLPKPPKPTPPEPPITPDPVVKPAPEGESLPPWVPAAAGAAAGATAATGALLMMAASGVRPKEVWDGMKDLMSQGTTPEPTHWGDAFEPLDATSPEPTHWGDAFEPLDTLDKKYPKPRPDQVAEIKFDSPEEVAVAEPPAEVEEAIPAADEGTEAVAEAAPVSEELPSQPSIEEQQREDIEYLKAMEELREEREKYEYTSEDFSGDQMEKIKDEMAAAAQGKIDDFEKIRQDLWIYDHAPTEDAAEDMLRLRDQMILETKDGQRFGDKTEIRKALVQELERTNQPLLTYVEEYALRDEVMENAKVQGEQREYLQDAAATEKSIYDLRLGQVEKEVRGAKITGQRTKMTDKLQHKSGLKNIGKGVTAVDAAGKISEGYGYYEGYKAAGNSTTLAATKAATQMGVKWAVDKATDNPVVGLMDTGFKYTTKAITGEDKSPSKAMEHMVNIAFDKATGELDRKPIERMDFNSQEVKDLVRQSQVGALEKQLSNPNLTTREQQELSNELTKLREK